ncbi:MAG: C-type lectin domain-containing protein [Myxococcota bacterium]
MRCGSRSLVVACGIALSCGDQVIGEFGADSGGDGTGDATDAGVGDETSSGAGETGAPIPTPEVCDGVDNDLDGLIDEIGPDSAACQDCTLLQGAGQAWWVCESQLDWPAANARCEEFGATSALVLSAEAQTFVHETVGEGWFWLGARQAPSEGTWSWVDGTPLTYDNWGGTQPDNTAPSQDCIRLTFGIEGDEGWFDGAWDDFFCDEPQRVLCTGPHAPD